MTVAKIAAALEVLYDSSSYMTSLAFRGGYAGTYSLDDDRAWGEAPFQELLQGEAWLQPPGTPEVGASYLRSYQVTADPAFLVAATDVGLALAEAQKELGGWSYLSRRTDRQADYLSADLSPRVTLDDDVTTGVLRFLIDLDNYLDAPWLTVAVEESLHFLETVQSPEGGWSHSYPDYGDYRRNYTYADNVHGGATQAFINAFVRWPEQSNETRATLLERAKLGAEFILTTQLGGATPAWAQFYDHDLTPAHGREFELPAAVSRESAYNIMALIDVYEFDRDPRYLDAARRAADWLRDSAIASDENGNPSLWTRYYELETNRPFYGVDTNGAKLYTPEDAEAFGTYPTYEWTGSYGILKALRYLDELLADPENFYDNVYERGPLDHRLVFEELEAAALAASDVWSTGRWETTGYLDPNDPDTRFFTTADFNDRTLEIQRYLIAARDELVAQGREQDWVTLVEAAREALTTGERRYEILGTGGDDDLLGGNLSDTLTGGAGNDQLSGGGGADIMTGGPGNDRFNVDHPLDLIVEDKDGGLDAIWASITDVILPENVENLMLFGAAAINGTGNAADNRISGNDGTNLLIGSIGNDIITGGAGSDRLLGSSGNDRIDGGEGVDRLEGGLGNDIFTVDMPNDIVIEMAGQGIDTVRAAADFSLPNHVENLVIIGSAPLTGTGNASDNVLSGNLASNLLIAAGGNDRIYGAAGDDRLLGGAGSDALFGEDGNDRLEGGLGNDTLTGGPGNDLFLFRDGTGHDQIADFQPGIGVPDVIYLRGDAQISSFAQILANAAQVGANTLIDLGDGDSLTLVNVLKSSLVADDFVI
ncbi:Ca2+-binding RTX toxin-like protein [Constrictibacter sp. MBR-5]|jgi:Ca2+-binding RTX toxin-like protein|uniref:pectate lyase n=1 Tax=Constrictibacter sp. MBR-5 TaxID=3156467 RepID=UPI003394E663